MKKEPLFELIKKMKQTEKAYFKKTATAYRKNSKNNFLHLFELIDKQRTYNETKLKEIIGSKHFAQKKQHLTKKIITSLKNYYSKDSIKTQIEALLHENRIYLSKSMLDSAEKSIEKAKKLTLESENYQLYLYVLKNEIEILKNKNDLEMIGLLLKDYKEIEEKVNKIVSEHIQLEELLISVVLWNNEMEYIRGEDQLLKLNAIFEQNKKTSNSKRSNNIYFYTSGIYHYLKSEHEESLHFFQKQLKLFHETNWLKEEMLDYIKCLANNCLLAIILNNTTYQSCYNELKEIQTEDLFLKMILNYYQHLLAIKHLSTQSKHENALEYIKLHENDIQNIEEQIAQKKILQNELMIMTFTKAETYIFNNEPKKAINTINTYLNFHDKKLKTDTYILSRLINIIIHFELQNLAYIEYEIESIKKWMKNKKIDFKFERTFLSYFENVIYINDNKELIYLSQNLLKDIELLKKAPFEKAALYVFSFENWIKKKMLDLMKN